MKVLAIDPGTRSSGVVLYDTMQGRVLETYKEMPNEEVLLYIGEVQPNVVVCEWVEHYGPRINAGADVFHTCRWFGRFEQAVSNTFAVFQPITRRQVKLHLCGNMRAKDKHVRQAIIDRYGGDIAAKGRKADPGPLYGVSSHAWSALALALTYIDEIPPAPKTKETNPFPPSLRKGMDTY